MKQAILIFSLLFNCHLLLSQDWAYSRLSNIDRNKPEKIEKIATRYTRFFPNNPSGYFFLSKNHFKNFEEEGDDKTKTKELYSCLKLAAKAQKIDQKEKITNLEEWIDYKVKVKREAFFFTQETSFTRDLGKVLKKYYLFVSNDKKEYLLESELELHVPQEERIDTLFYGLPTGKESVKRAFPEKEVEMLSLINTEREKMGLSLMKLDSSLSAACRYHAYDMATQNYSGHMGYDKDADGRRYHANYTFDRIRRFYNTTRVLGENISLGREQAIHTYKGWYNSPAHNKIMFKPENRLVGIGLVHIPSSEKKFYWVLCTAE